MKARLTPGMAVISALSALVTLTALMPPALAEPYYDEGMRRYRARDFKNAAAYFEQSIRNNPSDGDAYYYCALAWHQLKDWQRATARYKDVVNKFPDTDIAEKSTITLRALDPNFGRARASGGASKSAGVAANPLAGMSAEELYEKLTGSDNKIDVSSCPTTSKVYYTQRDHAAGVEFIVSVRLNNRPIPMCFDTGASTIFMGKNHLAQLGIAPPPAGAKPSGYGSGVGSSTPMPFWTIHTTLQVGDIIIPNCPINVCENLPTEPLLGQTFLKEFAYTIDYGAKSITFTKKDQLRTAGGGKNDKYAVPFVREGNEMVVDAEINGKPYKMYFDTGAMGIAFAPTDLKALNIEIPDDAEESRSIGVGGSSRSWHFPIRKLKVGPIEKTDIRVGVIEQSRMGKPLLGQDFYAGWQYTIDNERKLIHFLRR
jgi:clan AA aspartic protease (TIGR02281 family)